MYSAILVHALIDFAPPNDARASLHKMNSASEPVYPETIVKVRAVDGEGLVSHVSEWRSTMTTYLILRHSHRFPMVDLSRL
jgi:hypothetical protein